MSELRVGSIEFFKKQSYDPSLKMHGWFWSILQVN